MELEISEFKCLEELTISENTMSEHRPEDGPIDEWVPCFALVNWHDSFFYGLESLKKLTIISRRFPHDRLQDMAMLFENAELNIRLFVS